MRKHIDIPAEFTKARKKWGGNGSGSNPENVATLIAQLPSLIAAYGVRRVVDLGCGDVTWIAPLAHLLDEYTGVDVAPEPIAANIARYPGLKFMAIRTPQDELPQADLVIIRDCLAHLPCHLVTEVIAQARRAAPLMLATSFTKTRANLDCPAGGFRPLNLQARPFDLPHPLETLRDTGHKSMCLWRLRAPGHVGLKPDGSMTMQIDHLAQQPAAGTGAYDLDQMALTTSGITAPRGIMDEADPSHPSHWSEPAQDDDLA